MLRVVGLLGVPVDLGIEMHDDVLFMFDPFWMVLC